MFDTAYYLHYVLDTENDSHYTQDLMRLSPASYLWHELKECQGFSRVVFVNLVNGSRFILETFDNVSYQFLQPVKKTLFGKVKEQPVAEGLCHKTFYPPEIKQEDSTLLRFLLECQQNYKKERTAVVCTAEALKTLYERSDAESRRALTSSIENRSIPAILVVRLGMSTTALRKTFLQGCCFLSELDSNVKEVLRSHVQQPLITMLSRQLGGQLVDFSRQRDDMVNLLMYDALENGSGPDTPDQLRDQGEYLRLCLDSGVALAKDFAHVPRHEPLKRDTVYGKLADPDFRGRLRAEAGRLRARNPESPMADLFRREFRTLPDDNCVRELCCEDELYRKVCSLTLPEEYLRQNLAQGRVVEGLRKALATLWNKARSQTVCEMIRDTTDAALDAVTRQDWTTLTDALTLLSLCTRQICADPALNDNLDEIFLTGRELLQASADLNRQTQGFQDMYAGGPSDYSGMSKTGFDMYKSKLIVHTATDTILDGKAKKLGMLRSSLYDTILYFNDHPLSEQVEQSLKESMRRWKDKLDQVQADNELFGDYYKADTSDDWSPYGDL